MVPEELLAGLAAAGRRESSGAFTVDLKRLLPTLARFQLPSKDRIVLRFLAAAVASGATWFEYLPGGPGYQCAWDAVWPAEDLDRLFEFIASDRAERSELAVAVNAALGFGARIALSSGGQTLHVEGEQLTRGLGAAEEATRVTVTWPGWLAGLDRWVSRAKTAEYEALRGRGRWAPLELRGILEYRQVESAEVIRVGDPPLRLACTGSLPARARGAGYVFVGAAQSEVTIIVNGVGFAAEPYCPMLRIVWCVDLPLDLAREELVRGEELQELEAVLKELALAVILQVEGGRPEWRDWLMGIASSAPARLEKEFRLFERADRSFSNLQELEEQFRRDGFLAISRASFAYSSWPAHDVILNTTQFAAVRKRFPHCLPVGHLAHALVAPRLPEGPYLTRIPLSEVAGEAGLRADTLEVVTSVPAEKCTPDLFRALLYKRLSEDEKLVAGACIARALAPLGNLEEAVWTGFQHTWEPRDFTELMKVGSFRLASGGERPLAFMAALENRRYWSAYDPPRRGTPAETVLCDQATGEALFRLLGLENLERKLGYTGRVAHALNGVDVGTVVWDLWDGQKCVAQTCLRELKAGLKAPATCEQPVSGSVESALRMMRRSRNPVLSTDLLLLALLEDPQGFTAAWLQGHVETLRESLLQVRGQEALAWLKLSRPQEDYPVLWHCQLARIALTQGRYVDAWPHCEQALLVDREAALLVAAHVRGLLGRPEEALELLGELADSLAPSEAELWDACWASRAENHLVLGRLDEALQDCGQLFEPHEALRARIVLTQGQPEEALAAAEEALQSDICPASAHETRALALEALGRPDEAREAYRQFLADVRLYGLQENHVPERLASARHKLETGL